MTAGMFFCDLGLLAIEQLKMFIVCFLFTKQQGRKFSFNALVVAGMLVVYTILMRPLAAYISLLRWALTVIVCILIAKGRFAIPIALLAYPAISVLDMTLGIPLMYLSGNFMQQLQSTPLLTLCFNSLSIPILLMIAVAVRMLAFDWEAAIKGKVLILFLTILLLIGILETMVILAMPSLPENRCIAALISLSGANILIFLLYFMLLHSNFLNSKLTISNGLMQRQLELQKQYYMTLLEKEDETKRFRHDFRNHLSCMTALLDKGQIQQLRSYLTELTGETHAAGRMPKTGNQLLDVIVWSQVQLHTSVIFSCDGLCPTTEFLSDMDFCTVFSNVLSNAFESAELAPEHRVSMRFRMVAQNLLVTISNTAVNAPKKKHGRYISGKSEPGHGYGMQNLLQCLEKNHAEYHMEFADGIYTMNICFIHIS